MAESFPEGPSTTVLASFAGIALIGGTNFIAVKFSNEQLDPLAGAAIRFSAGALFLLIISGLFRYPFPVGPARRVAAIYGLLGFGVSYALLYYAIDGLGAGLTSVFVASVPLSTLLLAVLHGQERLTGRGIVGGLLAIGGIGILSVHSLQADLGLAYLVAAVVAVLAIGESNVIVKSVRLPHLMSANALAMFVGAIFLVLAAVVFGAEWAMPTGTKIWGSLLWLVVIGSAGLFWLYLYVIERWTASATSYALTLMPVVAIALGTLVADEELTAELVIGSACVLVAVYVGALAPQRVRPQPPA